MAVNGKRKGNNGEREVASIFSKYLGGHFQRIQSSGAYIGGKNSSRKEVMSKTQIRASKSDIIPPDEYEKLVIEVKSYKDLTYHYFVTCEQIDKVNKWITELEFDCDEGDFGMLCIKTNRKKWTVLFKVKYIQNFNLTNYAIYNDYVITGLENFLENNTEQLKKLLEG
jgi:Holliday junction resolvase